MAEEKNSKHLLGRTLQSIFEQNELAKKEHQLKKKGEVARRDMEVAVAVLLVELASADQNFEQSEYVVITNGLRKIFGFTGSNIQALINQSVNTLKNLRGTSHFSSLLRENLSTVEKNSVLEVVEEIIKADGKEDGYELYFRDKIKKTLGLD